MGVCSAGDVFWAGIVGGRKIAFALVVGRIDLGEHPLAGRFFAVMPTCGHSKPASPRIRLAVQLALPAGPTEDSCAN